eukprot:SAG31_NODE_5762_length_2340_cov_1.163592_2_plen_244_part_00
MTCHGYHRSVNQRRERAYGARFECRGYDFQRQVSCAGVFGARRDIILFVRILSSRMLRSGKLPGIHFSNVAGVSIAPMLIDPEGQNFRPKGGSALAALGAGAYALNGPYWIPGQRLRLPSHPLPSDGAIVHAPTEYMQSATTATSSLRRQILSWRPAYAASEHRIYAETVSSKLQYNMTMRARILATTVHPLAVYTRGSAIHGYHPLDLPDGVVGSRRVIWRVDVVDEESGVVRTGGVWTFIA